MKTKFYLKRPQSTSETSIFCRCSFKCKENTGKYKHIKIYTGLSIKPEFWNTKTGRAKETAKFPEHPEFNSTLDTKQSEIKTLFYELQKKLELVTPETFTREWQKLNEPEPKNLEFSEFAETFINRVENTRAKGTIKDYRNSLGHIKDFAQKENISLTFDNINLDFKLDFETYLKTEKNFAPNTIWRIIKVLKTFLNEAHERKLHNNLDYKSKRFSVTPVETDVIYLNKTDLSKLYNLNLSNNKKLDKVRDIFLIGCFTGLRFSDYKKATSQNIIEHEGQKMFYIKVQKTKDPVSIPLNPVVTEILDKYEGKPPKPLSNQKFNEYIKEIAEMAEINETVSITQTTGNLQTDKKYKKFELVSSHTARRSFCSNAYIDGMETKEIMEISGHKTERAFLSYLRLSSKEHAVRAAKHKFFTTPILKIAK